MGNHWLRLSDMMPNAWFYKLRDMRKPTKSFYKQPTKSCTKPARRRTICMPSPRRNTNFAILAAADVRPQFDDIIIDIDDLSLHLPPILIKPAAKQSPLPKSLHSIEIPSENGAVSSRKTNRKSGVKIWVSGGKPAGKKLESGGWKSMKDGNRYLFYSESFALVKSSFDPDRDFKDSMMEMIVENRIRELKDLEDLLACYLSLNSKQYHDAIISVFEQIWSDTKE